LGVLKTAKAGQAAGGNDGWGFWFKKGKVAVFFHAELKVCSVVQL